MNKIGITVLSLVFAAMVFCPSSFANIENKAEHIQVMRQAATELQASNPDLAKKLNDFADKKEKWTGEEGHKMLEQKREDLQKVRQASTELKNTNDNLAGELWDIAERWDKKLQEKEKHLQGS